MQLRNWCFVLFLSGACLAPSEAIVGGDEAAKPESDAAVVFVQKHGRSSRVEGDKHSTHSVYQFLGIRYAEPPTGQRRFQRPIRRYMAGEVLANRHCQPCPQVDPRSPNTVKGNEDCLCLNVFAPKMPGDEKGCAVIIFFHGGDYKSGSAIPFGGARFARNDTILVTVQYRLGALGFLSSGQKDASGNNGLFDMYLAKTWVLDYIEFFGGDTERIVLMGQGSGASAASLLALSGEDSNTRGVIALSGGPLSPGAVKRKDDPKVHANKMAKLTGCRPELIERLVRCLRRKSVEEIILADSKISENPVDTNRFIDDISGRTGAGARVEGPHDQRALPPLISEQPADALKKKQRHSALMTGVNTAETSKAIYGKYSGMLKMKLKTVRDFVQKELIGSLEGIVIGVDGLLPLGQAKQLENIQRYYQFVSDSAIDVAEGLSKIAEATADALFNFPAYQSVKAWSDKDSPAYMFSFEHKGNLTKGSHFLPGVALAEDDNEVESAQITGPSHGDELAYLFEALDEEGNPLPETISPTDERVRKNFLKLVTDFAHQEFERKNYSNFYMPFSKTNDQFLKIGEEIVVDKNFRFCQIGMWGGLGDRMSQALCQNIFDKLPKLKIPSVTLPLPGKLLEEKALPTLIKSPTTFISNPKNKERENEIDDTENEYTTTKLSGSKKSTKTPALTLPKTVPTLFGL